MNGFIEEQVSHIANQVFTSITKRRKERMTEREKTLEQIVQYAIPPEERIRILDEIEKYNFSVVSLPGGDVSFNRDDIPFIYSLYEE